MLVYGQIATFMQAESFIKPFRSNVVEQAKLEHSYSDYFGPSAHLAFFKKRDEQSVIPCDDAHGSVVPAKLTNALY
jgi:hypothetical protein